MMKVASFGAAVRKHKIILCVSMALLLFFGAVVAILVSKPSAAPEKSMAEKVLITVYDREEYVSFLTSAPTLKQAFDEADIAIDPRDTVEPSLNEELIAPEYSVNIYRARPVIVSDGSIRSKVMTPYQTPAQIAQHAGIQLYSEDIAKLSPSTDFVGDGAGLQMKIDRATPINLDLYGRKAEVRTQGKTVRAMLDEKRIVLGEKGRTSLPLDTPITAGLELRVWREGRQTVTLDEPISFATEQILDADRPMGYRVVTTEGKNGVSAVTYEIEVKDGTEISRSEIARIVTSEPVKQVLTIGIKSLPGALTKSKGAQYFTDSKGVSHRETYYDLNMSVVMRSCGQGGKYSVRFDGAKVDADGYVIIAANYGNYPKCSVVETSMGPGKVYDTGGFAVRHPHGFDLATDWSNPDGI